MSSISCDDVRSKLVDYIESEVPVDQRYLIKAHLQNCDECSGEYNGIRTMLGNANNASLVKDPGEEFWNELPKRVLREVKQEQAIQNSINNILNFSAAEPDVVQASGPAAISVAPQPPLPAHPSIPVFALAATLMLVISAFLFWSPQKTLRFDSADFQANINSDKELISLAHQLYSATPSASSYGFTDQHMYQYGFNMGTLLSETVSYLHGDDLSGANAKMEQMSQSMRDSGMPNNLNRQLGDAREAIQFKRVNQFGSALAGKQSIAELLDFQHAYENYLRMNDEKQLVMFKAAVWSYNIGLAALAEDATMLKQFARLDSLRPTTLIKEMVKIKVPSGVVVKLEQIDTLVQSPVFDERQFKNLIIKVQQLRSLLI